MKLQQLTTAAFMNQLNLNLDRVIKLRISATLPSLVKLVSAVAPPRGGEIYGSRAVYYYYFLFLYSLTRIQPIPVNRF